MGMNRRSLLAVAAGTTSLTGCFTDNGPTDDTRSSTDDTPPEIAAHTFEVTHVECDHPESSSDVSRSDGQVTITGSLRGSTTCGTASLESIEYVADADELRLVVRSHTEDTEAGCGDCIVEIEYEAVVRFDHGEPGSVAVEYTGDAKT